MRNESGNTLMAVTNCTTTACDATKTEKMTTNILMHALLKWSHTLINVAEVLNSHHYSDQRFSFEQQQPQQIY